MALQPGPWENDIRSSFTDPEEQERVDNFLRTRVQPRMTQTEQELARARQQYEATAEARSLLESFQTNPVETFNGVKQQLIDLGYTLEQAEAGAQQAATDAGVGALTPAASDPRLDEMYEAWQRDQQLQAYDARIAEIANDPRNADINPNRLHVFVAAADGDFDQALEMYRADIANVLTTYGIDPATATAQQAQFAAELGNTGGEELAPGAPPVMGNGSGAGAGAPVPTVPDYRAEGKAPQDALHDMIEQAAANMTRNGQTPPAVS